MNTTQLSLICLMQTHLKVQCTFCCQEFSNEDYAVAPEREKFAEALDKGGWNVALYGDENHVCCPACVDTIKKGENGE